MKTQAGYVETAEGGFKVRRSMARQIASSLDKTEELLDLTTTAESEHGVGTNSRISGEYPCNVT
ncbi:hypothetical protein GIB67_026696 [Kingdonia uniflora]|uniref:Uncharacterized protein n=1 Tax=Kingdonia uniflora TaxID=39325 RepID=A0A7J7M259_9MAGN|nr:hypothetical protein GIB67_026696 [Kingdonia uniflora]